MAEPNGKIITRTQAFKKIGYLAVSAATMIILLNKPNQAYGAGSPAPPPPW